MTQAGHVAQGTTACRPHEGRRLWWVMVPVGHLASKGIFAASLSEAAHANVVFRRDAVALPIEHAAQEMLKGADMITGSCLCGAVRYRVTGTLRPVVGCHCRQCRKTSGHHVAATSAAREAVEVTGAVTWFRSSGSARRGFCGTCGSNLFWDGPGEYVSIFAGTLDGETGLRLAGHIFYADKGDYYEIADRLPCHDGDDPGLTTQAAGASPLAHGGGQG